MKTILLITFAIVLNAGAAEWRLVKGVTNDAATADGWYVIQGKVISVMKDGLLVEAEVRLRLGTIFAKENLILKNHPGVFVDGDAVSARYAKEVGTQGYVAANSAMRTVRVYDCGSKCGPPADVLARAQKQIAVLGEKTHAEREERLPKLIAWEREQATNGVASAQYSLGMRYLKGDGLPQDPAEARAWLNKAAAKGHAYAKKALATIPP